MCVYVREMVSDTWIVTLVHEKKWLLNLDGKIGMTGAWVAMAVAEVLAVVGVESDSK